jgi:hypothetical protein
MAGHRSVRAQLRALRFGARALPFLVLLLLAAGCGDVHFIPSPYTPQEVELVYSPQEHITVVRWRVSAAAPVADTQFQLLGPDGYRTIDFSQSVFAGGVIACKDGTGACFQYVVRGEYTVDKDARPVQAVHGVFGELPGGLATPREVSDTLKLESFFGARNQTVYLNIKDDVAFAYPYEFPRPYERSIWPAYGLCVSETPTDITFAPLDATSGFPPPQPLTVDGLYCVATRPVPADGGETTLVQKRIATLPETISGTQHYEPPIEYSPVIYQLVLDLEIPVPDRCADVISKLESDAQRYMKGGGVPVYKLPTVNLAAVDPSMPCQQVSGQKLPALDMAQGVKQLITTLTGKHQQYHMMYFNNLDAPLEPTLITSVETLLAYMAGGVPGHDVTTYHWLFGPLITDASEFVWWFYWLWLTADEAFEHDLSDYADRTLPLTSQEHDDNEPVALLSASETADHENDLIKICSSSPTVTPIATLPFIHVISDPSWTITSADPPSYLVSLPQQVVVETKMFVEASARVDYQICTRYCKNHPYVGVDGMGKDSWDASVVCAGGDN